MQCIVISILVAYLAIAVVVVAKSTNDDLCSKDKATFAVYPVTKDTSRNKVMIKHSM
jgi:hypothetical protein